MKARHFLSFLRRSLRRSFLSDALLMSPDLASRFFLRRSRRSSSLGAQRWVSTQEPRLQPSAHPYLLTPGVPPSGPKSFLSECFCPFKVLASAAPPVFFFFFRFFCGVPHGALARDTHRPSTQRGTNLATFQCCHVLSPFPWHRVVLHRAHTSLYLALLNGFQSLLLHCLDALGLLDDLDAFLCANR